MRACGQSYASLEKLTALMNLLKLMTANNYDKIVNRLNEVVKEVANETSRDASEDLSKSKDPNYDTVIDTAVSCDGSWQKRGYSLLNGAITVISMDNGKILDIEPMTRACKSCLLHEKLETSDSKHFEECELTHICKISHIWTAGNMEPERAKRILDRSIRKNKTCYTYFYGDEDFDSKRDIQGYKDKKS